MNIVVIGNKRNSYTFKILNELIKANIKVKCLIEISRRKITILFYLKGFQKIGLLELLSLHFKNKT